VTAQEFWRRNAPARNLAELYYPPFSWADFERSLRKEAAGGDATLFGKFDFSETTGVASLKAALEELAGGQLPTSPDGQAVVPPRVFATLVQQAATVPMPLAEEERGRYPAWLATHVPPVTQAEAAVVAAALSRIDEQLKGMAYAAWLGFYNSAKGMGWDKPTLVQNANIWAGIMGCPEPPARMKKTIGMMGLKGVPGLRIDPTNGGGGSRGGGGGGGYGQ
jgi:hypothetical protein